MSNSQEMMHDKHFLCEVASSRLNNLMPTVCRHHHPARGSVAGWQLALGKGTASVTPR